MHSLYLLSPACELPGLCLKTTCKVVSTTNGRELQYTAPQQTLSIDNSWWYDYLRLGGQGISNANGAFALHLDGLYPYVNYNNNGTIKMTASCNSKNGHQNFVEIYNNTSSTFITKVGDPDDYTAPTYPAQMNPFKTESDIRNGDCSSLVISNFTLHIPIGNDEPKGGLCYN